MKKSRVHCLHIRKCGGTAFKNAVQHLTFNEYELELHGHGVSLNDIPLGEKIIFFVRDPLSRFISGFNDRKREGRPGYYYPHWAHETRLFNIFKTPNELGEALMNSHVNYIPALEAMRSIPHIMSSFSDELVSIEVLEAREKDLFYVGRQETLTSDFNTIMSLMNMEGVTLPNSPKNANSAPKNESTILSDLAKENLREWYSYEYKYLDFLENASLISGRYRS